jgi:hypothetical protein
LGRNAKTKKPKNVILLTMKNPFLSNTRTDVKDRLPLISLDNFAMLATDCVDQLAQHYTIRMKSKSGP